jgi:hypothetical protein
MEELIVKLPNDISETIGIKIQEQMKDSYYWNITKAVSDKLLSKLEENEFLDKIVQAVFDKIVIEEQEFINNISSQMKDTLLTCVTTIANETVNKVTQKITEYGFIKIGERY